MAEATRAKLGARAGIAVKGIHLVNSNAFEAGLRSVERYGMPKKWKVFATRPLPSSVIKTLAERCEVQFYREDTLMPPDQLAQVCREQEIEGLMVAGPRVTAELLEAAPHLRAAAQMGVGYDNIDVAACTARGVIVTNAAGCLEETTADLAFALLLAAARRVVEADRFVREGRWTQWQWELLWGADVHHKTLGLYGFGNIGQAVARRAAGFSMRILYHARRRVPESRELGAQYVDRETLIRESDFLSLHVPLTAETGGMISAREFGWMKPTAFLINTARGRVVDEAALVKALEQGRLAGAGLDVFEQEPKVHPELIKLPNVVLMPHVGSGTAETRTRMAATAAENLLAALGGKRPPNLINTALFTA